MSKVRPLKPDEMNPVARFGQQKLIDPVNMLKAFST